MFCEVLDTQFSKACTGFLVNSLLPWFCFSTCFYCSLQSFPCCSFSCVWPIYNTAFLFSPHLLCSLLPSSPSHSYKILSQILFSVWGPIAGTSQLLTGDLSLVSMGSGFQLHQFCFQFNDSPLKKAFLWEHLLPLHPSRVLSLMSYYLPTVTDLASLRQHCLLPVRKTLTFKSWDSPPCWILHTPLLLLFHNNLKKNGKISGTLGHSPNQEQASHRCTYNCKVLNNNILDDETVSQSHTHTHLLKDLCGSLANISS